MNNITIYEKYGGFDFFHNIIYQLYIELFDRIEVSYHFFGVDLRKLSLLQAQFLCEAIGGPPMYKGGDIQIVHKYMKVTDYEFETVVSRFEEIFKDNGLTPDEIKFIGAFIRSKKEMIVTSKNTVIDRIARYFYKRIINIRKFFKKLMNKFFLPAIIFMIAGCSTHTEQNFSIVHLGQQQILVSAEVASGIDNIFQTEYAYIQTIPEKSFHSEILTTLNVIKKIEYVAINCSPGQLACSEKNSPGTLFINSDFFRAPKIEQFTTILHEAKHLETGVFSHVKCMKQPQWGYECDEDLDASYGIEYKYLLHKYITKEDEQYVQVLKRLFNRINKI